MSMDATVRIVTLENSQGTGFVKSSFPGLTENQNLQILFKLTRTPGAHLKPAGKWEDDDSVKLTK